MNLNMRIINTVIIFLCGFLCILSGNFFALGAFLIAGGWMILYYDMKGKADDYEDN